jgi:hypothetical protein
MASQRLSDLPGQPPPLWKHFPEETMTLPAIYEPHPPAPIVAAVLGSVHCRIRPSVFRDEFLDLELPALMTVAEIIVHAGVPVPDQFIVVCWINGRRLGSECFGRVRPKAGTIVNLAVTPANARTALLIGGTLALTALSFGAGGLVAGAVGGAAGGVLGAVAAGGIALGGELGLNQ